MKWSETFIPTMKESPKEAEIVSHKLMLRGGFIQNLSSGLYIYMPLGKMVLDKIMKIIRNILNEYGAIELSMPALQPKEIWERTGRFESMQDVMMCVKDREDRTFVLGPTHEEIITDLVARRIISYRTLPKNFYQIQTKFRDEIRPRFGVIRAKEFIMKDGYSFDLTIEDCNKTYDKMFEAYSKIFSNVGIKAHPVEADTGPMGDGGRSHEFMAISNIGEDVIANCEKCNYAANLEKAIRIPKNPFKENENNESQLELIDTPNIKSVEEVASFFKVEPYFLIKTLVYKADDEFILVLVRGDIDVNEVKLKNYLKVENLSLADEKNVKNITNAEMGFAGPVKIDNIRIIGDLSITEIKSGITGANQTDKHYKNVMVGRDFELNEITDIGNASSGDLCSNCKSNLSFGRGIEVGQVFYLGTKYSEKLGAKVLNADGKDTTLIMGCYGIGVSRTIAAIIECNHDDSGIIWPISVAPFQVIIIPLDVKNDEILNQSLNIYKNLINKGVDVLFDDRNERAGFKFKDADLIGIPIRVVVGKKSLEQKSVEISLRKNKLKELIPLEKATDYVIEKINSLLEDLKNK